MTVDPSSTLATKELASITIATVGFALLVGILRPAALFVGLCFSFFSNIIFLREVQSSLSDKKKASEKNKGHPHRSIHHYGMKNGEFSQMVEHFKTSYYVTPSTNYHRVGRTVQYDATADIYGDNGGVK